MGVVTVYVVEYHLEKETWDTVQQLVVMPTANENGVISTSITGLVPNSPYEFRFFSRNDLGDSAPSPVLKVVTGTQAASCVTHRCTHTHGVLQCPRMWHRGLVLTSGQQCSHTAPPSAGSALVQAPTRWHCAHTFLATHWVDCVWISFCASYCHVSCLVTPNSLQMRTSLTALLPVLPCPLPSPPLPFSPKAVGSPSVTPPPVRQVRVVTLSWSACLAMERWQPTSPGCWTAGL